MLPHALHQLLGGNTLATLKEHKHHKDSGGHSSSTGGHGASTSGHGHSHGTVKSKVPEVDSDDDHVC